MNQKETFNESVLREDPATSRPVRQLTTSGLYNETPNYHYNTAFTTDSRFLVFATAREGGSALMRADVATGELAVVAVTDGVGFYGYHFGDFYHSPYAAGSEGGGFTGHYAAAIPGTRRVVACLGKSLRVYDLDTFEERVLVGDIGRDQRFGHPVGSPAGDEVFVTVLPEHPDVAAGNLRPRRTYAQACVEKWKGMPTSYVRIGLEDGELEEVFFEPVCSSQRIQPCPARPGLWLIDRDDPPTFWKAGTKRQCRAHLLDIESKRLWPLEALDAQGFQMHTNWNRSGDRVYYQGRSVRGGTYLGVVDTANRVVWEQRFPSLHYGHVSAHTRSEAMVVDSVITQDLVAAIHYEEQDATGAPRIELLARHGTQWDGMVGQYTHPHCHMSRDGKWLSFNKCENGHTNVHVVQLG